MQKISITMPNENGIQRLTYRKEASMTKNYQDLAQCGGKIARSRLFASLGILSCKFSYRSMCFLAQINMKDFLLLRFFFAWYQTLLINSKITFSDEKLIFWISAFGKRAIVL